MLTAPMIIAITTVTAIVAGSHALLFLDSQNQVFLILVLTRNLPHCLGAGEILLYVYDNVKIPRALLILFS